LGTKEKGTTKRTKNGNRTKGGELSNAVLGELGEKVTEKKKGSKPKRGTPDKGNTRTPPKKKRIGSLQLTPGAETRWVRSTTV